jgi:polysaccharide deacetylase 2 family uncharacterized protein YibQ
MTPDRWNIQQPAPPPGRGRAGLMIAYGLLGGLLAGVVAIVLIGPNLSGLPAPAATIALPRAYVAMPKIPADPALPGPGPTIATTAPAGPTATSALPPPAPPTTQPATPSSANPPLPPQASNPAPQPPSQLPVEPKPVITPVYSLRGPSFPPPPPEKPLNAQPVAASLPASRPDPVASLGDNPEPDAAGIVEKGPYGLLPRISPEGRLPFIVNAQRFNHAGTNPRVALAIMGLGLNAQVTDDAINKLPAGVSLIFDPYAPDVERWMRKARAAGHEIYIALPMEADTGSKADLGKRVLTTKLSPAETVDRLRWILSRSTVIAGVASWEGGAFLNSPEHYKPVFAEIAGRGLLVFDTRMARPNVVQEVSAAMGLPFARSLGFFDEHQDKETIDSNLATMEDRARQRRFAVAIGSPYPLTIDRVANWARGLPQRGFDLAPITGVTECGDICRERVKKQMAADGVAKP